MHRMLCVAVLVAVFCMLIAPDAVRAVADQPGPVIASGSERILNSYCGQLGVRFPLKPGQVLLFVARGVNYGVVYLIGADGVSPDRLQTDLRQALQGSELAQAAIAGGMHRGQFPVAVGRYGRGQMGATSCSSTLQLGRIIRVVRAKGWAVQAVLAVPTYAQETPTPPGVIRDRSLRLYNVSSVAPGYVVTVSARVSRTLVLLVLLAFAGLPVFLLSLLAVPVVVARGTPGIKKPLPAWYPLLLSSAVMVGNSLVIAFVIASHRDENSKLLTDLWLGSSTGPIALAAMGLFVLPVLVAVALGIEGRVLFAHPPKVTLDLTSEEQQMVKRNSRRGLLSHAAGYVVAVLVVVGLSIAFPNLHGFPRDSRSMLMHVIPAVAILLGSFLYLFRKRKEAPAPQFQSRLDNLTLLLGIKPLRAFVDESSATRFTHMARSEPSGKVVVAREAVDLLNPEEMEFLLARTAMAFHPGGAALRRMAEATLLLPFGLEMLALALLGLGKMSSTVCMLVLALVTPLVFADVWLIMRLARKRTEAKLLEVLKVTRNADAAMGAILKEMTWNMRQMRVHQGDPSAAGSTGRSAAEAVAVTRMAKDLGLRCSDQRPDDPMLQHLLQQAGLVTQKADG